jgi:eukaryotic-like serine/threonine-protein kinase
MHADSPPLSDAADRTPAGTDPAALRWTLVKELFFIAAELPEEERSEYLSVSCSGDPLLRAEIESLLASAAEAGSFCEVPAARLFAGDTDRPEPARLPPGTVLGNCEIINFLSAGGMGEVYRARHLLLGREVALKTVRGAAADPDARRRLLREARHAASLDHPGICHIHEVGVSDGVPWIVMPLIPGISLRERIHGDSLPLPELLSVAVQVTAALEHAHARGIVHRDLKSSNVLVDETGCAVVLDFGVSRRVARESGANADITATITGVLAGTLSHMAPEVLFGGQPDTRSDVWSLGVLLYEMATGELPFQGRTAFETSSAILNSPPAPLPPTVPLPLRLLIERCLVKDPARRCPSAAAVREGLEAIRRRRHWRLVWRLLSDARRAALVRIATAALILAAAGAAIVHVARAVGGAVPPPITTLAVLPLDHGDDAEARVAAAGITQALTEQLGEAAEVRLIAQASAAIVAADAGSALAAARRLEADAVVAGRVRRSGDRILVDARVIATSSGRVIWSDSFDRSPGQVLALHADIVGGVIDAIRLGLRPGADQRLATVRAVNPEAYEEYIRGRLEWNRRSPASLERAVAHFERATQLDPTWAPAYAALADCYNQFGTVLVGTGSPRQFRPRAEAAAIRALQIDPLSAEAHATLAYARHYDWRFAEAEAGFRRAIDLNPSYALARIWFANLLMSRGRLDEALFQVQLAHELDPFSPVVNTNVAWVLLAAGRTDEAVVRLSEVLVLDSLYSQARMRLIDALAASGRLDEAHEHAHRLVRLTGDWPPALLALAHNHARTAPDSARAALASLLLRREREHVSSAGLASLHDLLGDRDGALAWYERALEEKSNVAVYLRPSADTTRAVGHPRFRALLVAAGLH